MTAQTRVEARGLGLFRGGRWALRGARLSVTAGELLMVLGPNGAGKSTLLSLLGGLVDPTEGQVLLDGHEITALSPRERARRLAFVHQGQLQASGFTVREVVAMGRAPHQGALLLAGEGDDEAVERALEAFDLGPLEKRPFEALSGGEQRRVAIAQAFAQGAPTMLLDEPAAHLDLRHAHELHELLRQAVDSQRLACVCVGHDLNVAAQYADRVVLVSEGEVVADGTIEQVMTYARLSGVFGVELYVGQNELDGTRYFVPMRGRPGRAAT